MNKFNKIAAFSLLALAMNGSAHAEGWYAGLDLTTSKMDLDGQAKDLSNAGIIDDQLNGGSLIVGYSFKSWLAVEGGLHGQHMSQSKNGVDVSTNTSIDTSSISLAAKLSQPLAWGFSAYAKPGIAYTRTKSEFSMNIADVQLTKKHHQGYCTPQSGSGSGLRLQRPLLSRYRLRASVQRSLPA